MAAEPDLEAEEIAALLESVRERVRARYPGASVPVDSFTAPPIHVPLANLTPLLQARDAAQAKVAAIGSVNPRAGGLANQLVQRVKRLIARSLGWFVRDQITFNRQMLACIDSALDSLNQVNVSVRDLALAFQQSLQQSVEPIRNEVFGSPIPARVERIAVEINDVRHHWQDWRINWERNLAANEMQYLRAVADLQSSVNQRLGNLESVLRDAIRAQHGDYLGALTRTTEDFNRRVWRDFEKIRAEYDRLIHSELRVIRQHLPASLLHPLPAAPAQAALANAETIPFDYARFAERFRGSEAFVRRNLELYIPHLQAIGRVLDLGCGRGEFLELMRDRNIPARGIDLSNEDVLYCRSKGLDVEQADLFAYLTSLPPESQDAIFASQVVEHLDPRRLPELVNLCASRLRRDGLLIFETPNPECLAIFATHFYLDPTHTRPVPPPLLSFFMEEAGMGQIDIQRLSPAVESFPEIAQLPEEFASKFFGFLDYAIFGRKL